MNTATNPGTSSAFHVGQSPTKRFAAVAGDTVGERVLGRYLRYTPVLWVLGLLSPVGALILLRLFIGKVSISRVGFVVWAWWAVGFAQAACVFVNWSAGGLPASELAYRLGSAPVSGWFALGAALAIGKAYRLNSPLVVRSVCILGLYLLVFGALSMVIALFTGAEKFDLKSPIALLMTGDLPSISTLFTAHFFIVEDTFSSKLPRLILFYPWSACLGFAGIGAFFISLQERVLCWRAIGVLGGLLALAGSMSRAAAAALIVAGTLYVWRRWSRYSQFIAVVVICVVLLLLIAFDSPIFSGGSKSVTEMRAGSSEARQLGYDMSWQGFLKSPAFGYGWPGEFLDENIPMPIGSHSTIFGLLYTGGVLTIVPFLIAIVWTLAEMFVASGSATGEHRASFSIAAALAIICYGEGIYSFVMPALFMFFWMGSSLNTNVNYIVLTTQLHKMSK